MCGPSSRSHAAHARKIRRADGISLRRYVFGEAHPSGMLTRSRHALRFQAPQVCLLAEDLQALS